MKITDTERLDFILKYIEIDDIGDEEYIPGVIVAYEFLEDKLSFGPMVNDRAPGLCRHGDSLRDVIDKAIIAWGEEEK